MRRADVRRVLQQLLRTDVWPVQSDERLEQCSGHNKHQTVGVGIRVSKVSWSRLQGRGGDLQRPVFPPSLCNLCQMLSPVGHKITLCRGRGGQGDLLPRLLPTKVQGISSNNTCSFKRAACLGGGSCLCPLQGKGFRAGAAALQVCRLSQDLLHM